MGKNKRRRKIISGNKRVRKAVLVRDAMCHMQLIAMSVVFKAQLGAVHARSFIRGGQSAGDGLAAVDSEIILPVKKLTNEFKAAAANFANAAKQQANTERS